MMENVIQGIGEVVWTVIDWFQEPEESELDAWIQEECGHTTFPDKRHQKRLVEMMRGAAERCSGKVSVVFEEAASREGAYRWLENIAIQADDLGIEVACAERCRKEKFVFVPMDGTSLNLADPSGRKNFGSVGTNHAGARGLKVMMSLAVSPQGVILGIPGTQFWARDSNPKEPGYKRDLDEKELKYWVQTMQKVQTTMQENAPDCRFWFQLDREADAWPILTALEKTGGNFTVRGSSNRRLCGEGPRYIQDALKKAPLQGEIEISLPRRPGSPPHQAILEIRCAALTLDLKDRKTDRHLPFPVNVVWVREKADAPFGLEWTLLTNAEVDTLQKAQEVVHGYTQRWKIEEFFKTWKSGACDVEQTQLHSMQSVTKWVLFMASLAVRIERLKTLSRSQPDLPATTELSEPEIEALILLKRKHKKRTETISSSTPSLGQAVLWIAELGGYTGKSSGGPPGSITIRRGLLRLFPAAEMYAILSS